MSDPDLSRMHRQMTILFWSLIFIGVVIGLVIGGAVALLVLL